jgi:hypothetical protein
VSSRFAHVHCVVVVVVSVIVIVVVSCRVTGRDGLNRCELVCRACALA